MYKKNGRVVIRDFCEDDIENKVKWINNPDNNCFLHYDIPLEREKTEHWFFHKDDARRLDCVIEFHGIPVGLVGLLAIDFTNQKAEYYISMGEDKFKRKGIAILATKMILDYAFNDLKLNKVYLNMDAENQAANHLYEKAGFTCEGVFRKDLLHHGRLIDRKRFSILKEEFFYKPSYNATNILLLSVGTRNKVVQYFKRALKGKGLVIATDASDLSPAIYDADKHYVVPPINSPGYVDLLLDICRKEQVAGILSLIDPELGLLAKNEKKFNDVGTTVIGSSYDLCELAMDKMRMYQWLTLHGYNCAKSWIEKFKFYRAVDAGEVCYPVFVKPVCGSASINIFKAYDKDAIDFFFAHADGLMIQKLLNGVEIGADVYVDLISGEVVSIFTKKKIKMRAGETDKAVSFKNPELFALIEKFVLEAGYKGQIDIDIFDIDGQYYINEVNPRFGGGYPHAYESGCNHMKLILNNLNGRINEKRIGDYDEGIYMMKYNEVMIRRIGR